MLVMQRYEAGFDAIRFLVDGAVARLVGNGQYHGTLALSKRVAIASKHPVSVRRSCGIGEFLTLPQWARGPGPPHACYSPVRIYRSTTSKTAPCDGSNLVMEQSKNEV